MIAYSDDSDGLNSTLTRSVSTSGAYFPFAGNYADHYIGAYELTVTSNEPDVTVPVLGMLDELAG